MLRINGVVFYIYIYTYIKRRFMCIMYWVEINIYNIKILYRSSPSTVFVFLFDTLPPPSEWTRERAFNQCRSDSFYITVRCQMPYHPKNILPNTFIFLFMHTHTYNFHYWCSSIISHSLFRSLSPALYFELFVFPDRTKWRDKRRLNT